MIEERILQEYQEYDQLFAGLGRSLNSSTNDGFHDPHLGDAKTPHNLPSRDTLRQLLVTHFNESELQDLYFDLGIDYQSLPGSGKRDKARELVSYCQRHNCYSDLVEKYDTLRSPLFHAHNGVADTRPSFSHDPSLMTPNSSHVIGQLSRSFDEYTPFVGRETELQELAHVLEIDNESFNSRQIVVLVGPPGFGKTRTVRELVLRYEQLFKDCIFWVDFAGSDVSKINERIANFLDMGLFPPQLSIEKKVEYVRRVWNSTDNSKPRLFIFDNCEDIDLLQQFCPSRGRIIVTSCQRGWEARGIGKEVKLDGLPQDHSAELLRLFCDNSSPAQSDAIAAIAKELDNIPLALRLAGSYLSDYKFDTIGRPDRFLADLRDLREKHPALPRIERIFSLSFSLLDSASPLNMAARDLLFRAAYFALGEPIPRDIFLEETLELNADTPDALELPAKAMRRLENLGLLLSSQDGKTVRLTRLLADFALQKASQQEQEKAQEDVERVLIEVTDHLREHPEPHMTRLLHPHLRSMTDRVKDRIDHNTAKLCNSLGFNLIELGSYTEAHHYFQRAYEIREHILGYHHPETASSLNSLAEVLLILGDYSQARDYAEQALAILRPLGHTEPRKLALSLNILALVLVKQGEYADAWNRAEQALTLREKLLGMEHPTVAISLSTLARILYVQEKNAEAASYCKRALAIQRNIYGPRHIGTATSLNNLGLMLFAQGEDYYKEAEQYYQEALDICKRYLGDKHPSLVQIFNNLGLLQQAQKEYRKARSLYEQALTIADDIHGAEHTLIATIRRNLGTLLSEQGCAREARDHHEQALRIFEPCLGPDHIEVAQCYYHLGLCYQDELELERAASMLRLALPVYQKVLGDDHASTCKLEDSLKYIENVLQKQWQRNLVKIVKILLRHIMYPITRRSCR